MRLRNSFTAFAASAVLALAVHGGAADIYEIDPSHSEVSFRVRHLISKVPGRFTDFGGRVTGDPSKPEEAKIDLEIKATSIDTANEKRDQHLRSADFFDVATHPTITFKSKGIRALGQGKFEVSGALTMRGVTKDVVVPVELLGFATDPWGNERAGFQITTTLDRKDYGILWNQTLDAGGVLLGDEVEITINLEANKVKPAQGS